MSEIKGIKIKDLTDPPTCTYVDEQDGACAHTEDVEACPECGKPFCPAHMSVYDLDDDGNELIACFSCDDKHPMNKSEHHYWDCPLCLSAEGQPECAEFNRLSELDDKARTKFLAELAERKAVRS